MTINIKIIIKTPMTVRKTEMNGRSRVPLHVSRAAADDKDARNF